MEKSGFTEKEFHDVMADLFLHIHIVPEEDIRKNWNEAIGIMKHIDEEDVVFIAAALSISDSVIWSDDGHFEKQDKVKVLKTEEMV